MSSTIKFACKDCGKAYKVPAKYAGKKLKCKACDADVRVPAESQSGVSSKRAAAVSGRSSSSSRSSSSKSGRSSSSSSKSGRSSSSSSSKSGRSSSKSGRSSSSSKSKAKKAKPGAETERFKAVDLQEGNEAKRYNAKKSDEEFKRGEGRLTYFESGKAVKAFKLSKGEAKIGRDASCGICLPLSSVSREHSKVEYKLGTFIATDLNSKNGLVVNGRTVRRVALRNGDIIQIGQGILRLDC